MESEPHPRRHREATFPRILGMMAELREACEREAAPRVTIAGQEYLMLCMITDRKYLMMCITDRST